MAQNLQKEIEKDFTPLKGKVLGILLYGSKAEGTDHARSDVDVCLVAGGYDPDKLFQDLLATNLTGKYDVKIFELLPLKVKGSVLESHKIIWSKDVGELNYYLLKYVRIWADQKLSLKKLGLALYH